MKLGKFIVIEGMDGAGKSTQVKLLHEKMKENGVNIYVTREASDGPIGKLLRSEYLSGKRQCDEHVLNYLYAADRLDHISNKEDGMLKYIEEGTNVLCDRYYLSSLAYDTYMHWGTKEYSKQMNDIINRNMLNIQLLSPDLTIFIDLPVEVCLERLQRNRDELSIYETKDKLEKIKLSYMESINILQNQYDHNICIIDGNRSIDEISYLIWEKVKELF